MAACSKHPSSLVGVWKNGEQGLISTQMVLSLKEDGTGALNASMGIFGGGKDAFRWEYQKPNLLITTADGGTDVMVVVSQSKTDLVLQSVKDGSLLSFRRISDEVVSIELPAATKSTRPPAQAAPPPVRNPAEQKIMANLRLIAAAGRSILSGIRRQPGRPTTTWSDRGSISNRSSPRSGRIINRSSPSTGRASRSVRRTEKPTVIAMARRIPCGYGGFAPMDQCRHPGGGPDWSVQQLPVS
ncbi:MAG: hypothetical protein WDM96_00025 [Lacunisphaera sp.]